jgi:hypothetical protein
MLVDSFGIAGADPCGKQKPMSNFTRPLLFDSILPL